MSIIELRDTCNENGISCRTENGGFKHRCTLVKQLRQTGGFDTPNLSEEELKKLSAMAILKVNEIADSKVGKSHGSVTKVEEVLDTEYHSVWNLTIYFDDGYMYLNKTFPGDNDVPKPYQLEYAFGWLPPSKTIPDYEVGPKKKKSLLQRILD
jgi:hypothetical protein